MENHEKNGKFRQKRMNFTTNHLFQSVIDSSTGKEIEIHFQIRHFGKDWSNASKVIQEKPRKKRGGGYMCLFWVKNRTKLGITIFGGTVGRTWAGHYFNLGCLER